MTKTRNYAEVVQKALDSDPRLAEMVEDEEINAHIAQQLYTLRTGAKLTQAQLAKKVGTTQSVIARLEDADYSGHSIKLLRRIARVFGNKVRVEFYGPGLPAFCSIQAVPDSLQVTFEIESLASP